MHWLHIAKKVNILGIYTKHDLEEWVVFGPSQKSTTPGHCGTVTEVRQAHFIPVFLFCRHVITCDDRQAVLTTAMIFLTTGSFSCVWRTPPGAQKCQLMHLITLLVFSKIPPSDGPGFLALWASVFERKWAFVASVDSKALKTNTGNSFAKQFGKQQWMTFFLLFTSRMLLTPGLISPFPIY